MGVIPSSFANPRCSVKRLLNDQLNERWCLLCQLAEVEPDSRKLKILVDEVNFLLDIRNAALTGARRPPTSVRRANGF